MKVSNYNRFALEILVSLRCALITCAAVATLAGCGGASNVGPTHDSGLVPNVTQGGHTVASTGLLDGEVLTGAHVRVRHVKCHRVYTADFHATGSATGPYPGTFVAKGSWDGGFFERGQGPFWHFSEQVAISSGASSIIAVVQGFGTGFGPIRCGSVVSYSLFQYTIDQVTQGFASTTGISKGVFSESFQ
jgi:hypothetical protein